MLLLEELIKYAVTPAEEDERGDITESESLDAPSETQLTDGLFGWALDS
jgi:hypothetical protein